MWMDYATDPSVSLSRAGNSSNTQSSGTATQATPPQTQQADSTTDRTQDTVELSAEAQAALANPAGANGPNEQPADAAQTGSGIGMAGHAVSAPRTPGGSWARGPGSSIPHEPTIRRLQGTNPNAGQPNAFDGVRGQSAEDAISRVPRGAERPNFDPGPTNMDGVKFKWNNADGSAGRMRIHGPDPAAPAGSNSAEGYVARIESGKTTFNGDTNSYVKPNVFNENSPMYDAAAANGAHVPLKGNPTLGAPAEEPSALSRLGGVAEKAGGVLAIGGGAVQTAQGIDELRHGQTLDGAADTGGGVLNVAGGAALLAGGTAATVAAPLALGGAAALDGGRELIHGIQSGNAEQIGVGSAKTLGGSLMMAGGVTAATGLGAPVGAALFVAGGVMYAGASIYENREAIGHAIGSAASAVGDAVSSGASAVGHAVSSGAATVEHAAGSVVNAVGDGISSAASGVAHFFGF
jgi:hypothetical protein